MRITQTNHSNQIAQVPVPTAQVTFPTAQVAAPTTQEVLNLSANQTLAQIETHSRQTRYAILTCTNLV